MAYPKGLLSDGEEVVLDLHPHGRALVVPLALVPVVIGLGTFLAVVVPGWAVQGWVRLAIGVAAVVLLARLCLWPFLRWVSTQYVVTTNRIVLREGVLSRSGRDVPLNRVNDVTFSHSVGERLFRSGTLVVESAGERGQVVLVDVPRVSAVQRTVYDLVQEAEDRDAGRRPGERSAGEWPPREAGRYGR